MNELPNHIAKEAEQGIEAAIEGAAYRRDRNHRDFRRRDGPELSR